MTYHKIFDKGALIPPGWLDAGSEGDFYTFNPAIFRHDNDILMAVRICGPERLRKIAILRLDHQFEPLPEPPTPLSDHFRFCNSYNLDEQSLTWFAEPRLFSIGKRLFLHFNNGGVAPNRIFLVELDPCSLLPLEDVREVELAEPRRPVEKNWIFFGDGEDVYVIYTHSPFQVFRVDFTQPSRIFCRAEFQHSWDALPFTARFGEIRGGTTPVRDGSSFVTMFHCAHESSDRTMLYYAGGLMRFEGTPPFRPLGWTGQSLVQLTESELAMPFKPSLNMRAKTVFYPCGLIVEADGLLVSYGVNDEYAALRWIALQSEKFEEISPGEDATL